MKLVSNTFDVRLQGVTSQMVVISGARRIRSVIEIGMSSSAQVHLLRLGVHTNITLREGWTAIMSRPVSGLPIGPYVSKALAWDTRRPFMSVTGMSVDEEHEMRSAMVDSHRAVIDAAAMLMYEGNAGGAVTMISRDSVRAAQEGYTRCGCRGAYHDGAVRFCDRPEGHSGPHAHHNGRGDIILMWFESIDWSQLPELNMRLGAA